MCTDILHPDIALEVEGEERRAVGSSADSKQHAVDNAKVHRKVLVNKEDADPNSEVHRTVDEAIEGELGTNTRMDFGYLSTYSLDMKQPVLEGLANLRGVLQTEEEQK